MKISFNPPRKPDHIDGIRVSYDLKKRLASKWRWYLILFLVLSPLLYFTVTVLCNSLFTFAPGVVTYKTYSVMAPVSGHVHILPLREGELVGKWQLLGTIQDEVTVKRINYLKNAMDLRKVTHKKSEMAALEVARRSAAHQADYFARIKALMYQGAATRAEYNEAEMRYEAALSQLAQLKSLSAGCCGISRDAEEEIKLLELTKETPITNAGSNGIILAIHLKDGQYAVHGAPVMDFIQPNTALFTAYLPASRFKKAVIGKKVVIHFIDGRKANAVVSSIKPLTEKVPTGIKRDIFKDERLALPVILSVLDPQENIPHNFAFTVNFGIYIP